ncbi:MAG: dTDP-4-dehydrorhamnose 3,5-epimerase [Bacteroidia bacterium]|nr:MAG: dTDP-4-dehydrorhamnose 3,5-epimerase [Bacteroidia bacterium]
MNITSSSIPDVLIIEPQIFGDSRGYFYESYNKKQFDKKLRHIDFVQDNESKSSFGVVRGMHFQRPPFAQSKLVRVIKGSVYDVVLDLRKSSPTFLQSFGIELNETNKKMLFIPKGFAHGFAVLSKEAVFSYKVDNYYSPENDAGINIFEEKLNINWQIEKHQMILSDKDKALPYLNDIDSLFE